MTSTKNASSAQARNKTQPEEFDLVPQIICQCACGRTCLNAHRYGSCALKCRNNDR